MYTLAFSYLETQHIFAVWLCYQNTDIMAFLHIYYIIKIWIQDSKKPNLLKNLVI